METIILAILIVGTGVGVYLAMAYSSKEQMEDLRWELSEAASQQTSLALFNNVLTGYQTWFSGFGRTAPIEAGPALDRLDALIDALSDMLKEDGGDIVSKQMVIMRVSDELQKLYRKVPTPFDFDEDGRIYVASETLKLIEQYLDKAEEQLNTRTVG